MTQRFDSPLAAEAAFYEAFQSGDFALMAAVWSAADDVLCIHPGGPRLAGRSVLESWREILERTERALRVAVGDRVTCTRDGLAVHSLREHISLHSELHGVMLATNVYRQEADGWRLILHQAAPDPAAAGRTVPAGRELH